jgi:hypothetical protein
MVSNGLEASSGCWHVPCAASSVHLTRGAVALQLMNAAHFQLKSGDFSEFVQNAYASGSTAIGTTLTVKVRQPIIR